MVRYDIVATNGGSWYEKMHPDGLYVRVEDAISIEASRYDLLAACEELVGEFDERNRELQLEPGNGGYADTGGIVLARSAIARAKGE